MKKFALCLLLLMGTVALVQAQTQGFYPKPECANDKEQWNSGCTGNTCWYTEFSCSDDGMTCSARACTDGTCVTVLEDCRWCSGNGFLFGGTVNCWYSLLCQQGPDAACGYPWNDAGKITVTSVVFDQNNPNGGQTCTPNICSGSPRSGVLGNGTPGDVTQNPYLMVCFGAS